MLLMGKSGGGSAALKSKVDILFRLAEGTLYDTQTNAQTAYSKTAPAGSAAAEISSIGGKTVEWNQQLQNAVFHDSSVWQGSRCSFSADASGGKLTFITGSGVQAIMQNVSIIAGHVYLVSAYVIPSKSVTVTVFAGLEADELPETTATVTEAGGEFVKRITATASGSDIPLKFGVRYSMTAGDTMVVKYLHLIDLTQMFGAGHEPAASGAEADAAIAYAKAHPAHNAGTLMHAAVTEVVSEDTDGETLGALTIPAAIRALEGYGQSEIGGNRNALNLASGTYTEVGRYVDGVWTALDAARVTDVSGMLNGNLLPCEGGGKLTFVQDGTEFAVPSSVGFMVKRTEGTE